MLKPKQKKLAEIMVAEPELNNEQYAEKIGIDPSTLYAWKKKDEFNEYVHNLCKERFKDMEKLAMNRLKQHVENGNWKATQYVLDGLGYKPEEKIDITSGDININVTGEDND